MGISRTSPSTCRFCLTQGSWVANGRETASSTASLTRWCFVSANWYAAVLPVGQRLCTNMRWGNPSAYLSGGPELPHLKERTDAVSRHPLSVPGLHCRPSESRSSRWSPLQRVARLKTVKVVHVSRCRKVRGQKVLLYLGCRRIETALLAPDDWKSRLFGEARHRSCCTTTASQPKPAQQEESTRYFVTTSPFPPALVFPLSLKSRPWRCQSTVSTSPARE